MLADAALAEKEPPLVLTMAAVERLTHLLEDAGEAGALLRIEAYGDDGDPGFRFGLESEADAGDTVLDYVRISVLLDADTHQMLRGFELDHRSDDEGERFVIRRSE